MPLTTRAALQSDAASLERARGRLALRIRHDGGTHAIGDLLQEGCGRFLFPARRASDPAEAVLVNTGGGLTGGDRFSSAVTVEEGAQAIVTTQACEKIYRANGADAVIVSKAEVAPGARLLWIPQETILFDGSRLKRSLSADVAADASFLAAEAVVLGRAAMGEELRSAKFRDSWRIRRGGRLVFAEETAASGDWERAFAAKASLGEGTGAFATLVLVSPDAGEKLDDARALLESHAVDGGASVVDGLLVVRLVAGAGLALRKALIPLIEHMGGLRLPRVWNT